MSKTLVIFGATGQQGSSVLNYVLSVPAVSQQYKIRAITRDVDSRKSKEIKGKGNVEVVECNVSNRSSLQRVLTDAHTIFVMTTPSFDPDAFDIEFNTGKTIADAAVEKGVQYIIFSTLPSISKISGGKYTGVTPFDAKAKIEDYIRNLPVQSAFVSLGSFMENFAAQTFLAPKKADDGTWVMSKHTSADMRMPLINAIGDVGKFVGTILVDPEKYEGKTLCAAERLYTQQEIVDIMSKSTGEKVVYNQISTEEFKKGLEFGGDMFVDIFVDYFSNMEEFGYYGPEGKDLVAWAAGEVEGKLVMLEEYFEKVPLKLE